MLVARDPTAGTSASTVVKLAIGEGYIGRMNVKQVTGGTSATGVGARATSKRNARPASPFPAHLAAPPVARLLSRRMATVPAIRRRRVWTAASLPRCNHHGHLPSRMISSCYIGT